MRWDWNYYHARRLADAGALVELKRYDSMLHAFFTMGHELNDGRDAAVVLRRALG